MSFFTTLFLVATIGLVSHMIITIVKVKQGRESNAADGNSLDQLREMEARLESMERRLQNVETITTAKDYNLERKFEELAEK